MGPAPSPHAAPAPLPAPTIPPQRRERDLSAAARLAGVAGAEAPPHARRAAQRTERNAPAEPPRREPSASAPATSASPAPGAEPTAAPAPAASAAPRPSAVPADWTPAGPASTGVAHVRVATDTLGDVALHLRIRDGAATVRLEADATAPLEGRSPELARALAAEGITLARLDVDRRDVATAAAPREPTGSGQAGSQGQPGAHLSGGSGGGAGTRGDETPPPAAPNAAPPPARPPRRARPGAHDVTA
jgi:hypothetical protein